MNVLRQSLRHPALWRCLLTGGDYAEVTSLHVNQELSNVRKQHTAMAVADIGPPDLPLTVANMRDRLLRRICFSGSYLYGVVRLVKPNTVVETGVHYGISTAFILAAMHDNGNGELWSVDLPNQQYQVPPREVIVSESLPPGCGTGFVIPGHLRHRWHLVLGDSREVLPQLLDSLVSVDIFIHDSAHTDDVMRFEYETAWPHIRPGGLLLSDDVGWNTAFADFANEVGGPFAISKGQAGILAKL
jgi:hypothetical protein